MKQKQKLTLNYGAAYPYLEAVLDFIYPRFCVVCKNRLHKKLNLICQTCWHGLPQLKTFDNFDLKNLHIARCLSIWEFDEGIQKVIHEMKFFGKKSLAKLLGAALAKIVCQDSEYLQAGLIIPVPLHKTKLRERGFNQSLLLSEQIFRQTNIPIAQKTLQRIRYTKPQSRLTTSERERNVQGAFKVFEQKELLGQTVILVDDVLTTGSTVKACAEALKHAGVEKVLVVTAAATL